MFRFSLIALFALSIVQLKGQDSKLPNGRASAHLIYHPASKAMLLIDGYQVHLDSPRNDVWKWNGKGWEPVFAYGPGTRSLSACALNPKTGNVEIFAGIGYKNYETKKADTWTFDGQEWKQIMTNNIGTRDHHKMVYVDHLNAFVVYGGFDSERKGDTITWIRVGNEYRQLKINGPGLRYHFAMAYDKNRKRVVLYGGGKGEQRDDLWEFDGQRWTQIEQKGPGPRFRHSLVYDEETKRVVMHGSSDDGITWEWDGIEWKKIATGGPREQLIALGYDPVHKVILAFGGAGDNTLSADLWELSNGNWRKLSGNGVWRWENDKLIWSGQ